MDLNNLSVIFGEGCEVDLTSDSGTLGFLLMESDGFSPHCSVWLGHMGLSRCQDGKKMDLANSITECPLVVKDLLLVVASRGRSQVG